MKYKKLNYLVFFIYLISSSGSYSIERPNINNLIIHKEKKIVGKVEFFNSKKDKSSLDNYKQNLTIINFWATWCAPCIREIPSLKTLKNLITDDNFEIIMIAAGRNSVAKIENFILEGQLFKLKSYRDPYGELSASLGVLGLPTTLIIGCLLYTSPSPRD